MTAMSLTQRFDSAAACLAPGISGLLEPIHPKTKEQVQEIRLRLGRPLALYNGYKHLFVGIDQATYDAPCSRCYTVTAQDVDESFKKLCGYSVHSHIHEIKDGYLSVRGGHRAGICGTMVLQEGRASGMRDITSINLRVAKEVGGAANEIVKRLALKPYGLLLAGAPSSGKTTILRDLARQLGGGELNYKVTVVDERGELGASWGGVLQNDLGCCTDVLTGCRKGEGILLAVRSLSPQIIICDEIGTDEEISAVQAGLGSGVVVIASVHAGNQQEFFHRPQLQRLVDTGAFEEIIFLHGAQRPSQIKEICKAGEWNAQISGGGTDLLQLHTAGAFHGSGTLPACETT